VAWVALSDLTHSFPQETRAVVETEYGTLQGPLPTADNGIGFVKETEVTRVPRVRDVSGSFPGWRPTILPDNTFSVCPGENLNWVTTYMSSVVRSFLWDAYVFVEFLMIPDQHITYS
jgi:hypothetical protein